MLEGKHDAMLVRWCMGHAPDNETAALTKQPLSRWLLMSLCMQVFLMSDRRMMPSSAQSIQHLEEVPD
jgi:hypothetical protein